MHKPQSHNFGWEKPILKNCIAYESSYLRFSKSKSYSDNKQSSCWQGIWSGRWCHYKAIVQGSFGSDGAVLYLYCGCGYTNMYMYKNSDLHTKIKQNTFNIW